ncbi:hypothetical protein ACVU7I_02360 [Patulibacter sp. S7RM1-6]
MLAHDREDALVTAQEIQRVIAARRRLRDAGRREAAREKAARHGIVASSLERTARVGSVLRAHDHRIARH